MVNKQDELKRLKKEEKKIKNNILKIQNKVSNKKFLELAPKDIVQKAINKLSELNKIYQKNITGFKKNR